MLFFSVTRSETGINEVSTLKNVTRSSCHEANRSVPHIYKAEEDVYNCRLTLLSEWEVSHVYW
jgi:hypothetical protein